MADGQQGLPDCCPGSTSEAIFEELDRTVELKSRHHRSQIGAGCARAWLPRAPRSSNDIDAGANETRGVRRGRHRTSRVADITDWDRAGTLIERHR